MWDVFISHAWEDKEAVARPIADALTRAGLKVWYDEFTLMLGDSLRRSIDNGLANSKYGIVILSPSFFAKDWPQRELDGLIAKETASDKAVLPIWHNLTRADILKYSPMLSDRLAVSTSAGLSVVVQEIVRVVHHSASQRVIDNPNRLNTSASRPVKPQQTATPTSTSKRFDLASMQQLTDYAYSTSGIDLSRQKATEWAENHLDYFSVHDFDKFKQLATFAYSTSGADLSRQKAAEWAENNLEYFSSRDFAKFQELVAYAYSTSGADLSRQEAVKWALRYYDLISIIGLEEFKNLVDYAYSTSGLNLSRKGAVDWALKRASSENA